jgi:glycosyltransferase involved in cell wall biosynthesis
MPKISVVIITKNEEKNISRCLESVKGLADEILVVDDHSTDGTTDICRSFGCRVILHAFEGYGKQKQFAVDQAANEWILSLDADEVATRELWEEIRSLSVLDEIPDTGYRIPFSLFYMGRILKHSGTGKESHIRLFDRRRGGFTDVTVHEGIEVQGPVRALKGKIIHYSYRDLSHHLQKIDTYTSDAATGYTLKGRHFSKCRVAWKFPVSFFIFYILKGGILDGYPGFLWSFMAAFYGAVKVAKTIEKQEKA